ncbi:hypothetical protein BDZ89DRAFT_1137876 [Hymenopellis radicata]|nr:hypothetical protein BDZ89DRAFT_1137876 [Hymenopellis radicata]
MLADFIVFLAAATPALSPTLPHSWLDLFWHPTLDLLRGARDFGPAPIWIWACQRDTCPHRHKALWRRAQHAHQLQRSSDRWAHAKCSFLALGHQQLFETYGAICVGPNKVVFDDLSTTSQIAGALWEWPPAVCGKHTDVVSLHNSKRWCMTPYRVFDKLQKMLPPNEYLDHGVRMRMANVFFDQVLEEMPDRGQLDKYEEIVAQSERRTPRRQYRQRTCRKPKAGVVDAYQHLAPVIDTNAYAPLGADLQGCGFADAPDQRGFAMSRGRTLGGVWCGCYRQCHGSRLELAADASVYPLRGALIRVVNDGKAFPKVTEALAVTHDDTRGENEDIVFIVPRNDNTLILGGLAQPHKYELDLTFDSPEVVRMREWCNNFVPGLENAEYDPDAPLVQGLRPFRGSNVPR